MQELQDLDRKIQILERKHRILKLQLKNKNPRQMHHEYIFIVFGILNTHIRNSLYFSTTNFAR